MIAGEAAFTRAELEATALASLGWWHHSIENTIDKLDWTSMQDHLRVYAGWIWEMATAPVLPFEFVGVADQFIERLNQLRVEGDPINLTGAIVRAQYVPPPRRWMQRRRHGETATQKATSKTSFPRRSSIHASSACRVPCAASEHGAGNLRT